MPWNDIMGEGYLQSRKDWLTTREEQRWMLQARSIMLKHLGRPFDGEIILDIGSSAGHAARSFLGKPKGHREKDDKITYCGVDSEPEYIRVGREFFKDYDRGLVSYPHVGFFQYDMTSLLPFPLEANFVICNNVPIHCPHFIPALPTMLGPVKLKRGGMLIWRTMLGEKEIIWKSPKLGIHLNQYAFSDVLPFIRDSGFEVKVLPDAYLKGVPQLVWDDQVRTYYVVVARRK